jgi:hypothetical protein
LLGFFRLERGGCDREKPSRQRFSGSSQEFSTQTSAEKWRLRQLSPTGKAIHSEVRASGSTGSEHEELLGERAAVARFDNGDMKQ